jgi:hypothetical protein
MHVAEILLKFAINTNQSINKLFIELTMHAYMYIYDIRHLLCNYL